MTSIMLLPVFKIQIEFQVKHGRRWTPFEHLLLWAISTNRRTAADLAQSSNAPVRLVVEALINLMTAGWIEVQSTSHNVFFVITELGKSALQKSELPYDFRYLKRYRTLYIERMTERVFKTEGVRLLHFQKASALVEAKQAVLIEPSVYKATLRPIDIIDKLSLEEDDQFEMWNDHRVLGANLYALVRISGSRVSGLPEELAEELSDRLCELDRKAASPEKLDAFPSESTRIRLTDAPAFRRASISLDDIIVGGDAHFTEIERIIDAAKTHVVIHSTFMSAGAIRRIFPLIEEKAAKSAVEFDLLWGDTGGAQTETWKQVKVIEEQCKNKGIKRVRVATEPTGSHCKLVLADCGRDGSYEAVIGSCNWLSSLYSAVDVSVRVRDLRLVRDVANVLAGLQMPASGRWDRSVMRLVRIAEACRKGAVNRSLEGGAMLIFDEDHYVAVRNARDAATTRIVAGCDWIGTAAETSVFVPMRSASETAPKLDIRLFHQRIDERVEDDYQGMVEQLSANGIQLAAAPNLHAKFLVWDDDTAVVTSFNWLSTATRPYSSGPSEVGLLIQQPGIGSAIAHKLSVNAIPALGREASAVKAAKSYP